MSKANTPEKTGVACAYKIANWEEVFLEYIARYKYTSRSRGYKLQRRRGKGYSPRTHHRTLVGPS